MCVPLQGRGRRSLHRQRSEERQRKGRDRDKGSARQWETAGNAQSGSERKKATAWERVCRSRDRETPRSPGGEGPRGRVGARLGDKGRGAVLGNPAPGNRGRRPHLD